MNPEQEPNPADKSDIDPSINPKVLIEQEGPNAGAMADPELAQAGAERENLNRDNPNTFTGLGDKINEIAAARGQTVEGFKEDFYDKTGETGLEVEMKNRATELAQKQFPHASPELVQQFANKAAEKFRTDSEAKKAELVEADNKGLQELIDSLDSKPLSEVVEVPESESEAAKAFR